MSSNCEFKNKYSIFEIFSLGFSVIMTHIFYPKAKLITYPVYMRGKKSLKYGDGFSVGYGCRFDLINPNKITLYFGDDCQIGDYCHFVATDEVKIGNNFLCASKVFISDTNHGNYRGNSCADPMEAPKYRKLCNSPVSIGDNVWVGENVVILSGTTIGNGCIIGANSVVTGIFEDNCILAGVPAKVIKKYNEFTKCWEKSTDNK